MKKSLSSLDYVKLLFAVVVVAIHTDLFVNYKTGNILFTSFFAESAVPFFFIVSGFFIGSKYRNSNNSFKVIFSATKKYGIIAIVWGSWYTIFSILVNIFTADFRNPVAIIKNNITKSLLGSPGGGTWYIVALFWGCLCLSILARAIDLNKRKRIMLISCFLFYIIPYIWWIDFDIFNCIRTIYNSYFTGKTLFVFFLIYFIYGFYFNCDSLVRLKERNKKICQICLGLLIIFVGGGQNLYKL